MRGAAGSAGCAAPRGAGVKEGGGRALCRLPSAFQNRSHSHASGGANRNQAAFGAGIMREQLRKRCEDARAGGGEGVPERDAAAFDVEARAIDGAERLFFPEEVPAVVLGL